MNVKTVYKRTNPLQAVHVTKENMADVAKWCGGTIVEQRVGRRVVKVPGLHPTVATASPLIYDEDGYQVGGDWILRDLSGRMHIVSDAAFQATYVEVRPKVTDDGTT